MSPYLALPLRTLAQAQFERHWARLAALPVNDTEAKVIPLDKREFLDMLTHAMHAPTPEKEGQRAQLHGCCISKRGPECTF